MRIDPPVHAVCCREDPERCDDGASTQVFTAEVEADLPGELTRLGAVASDDTAVVLRSGTALWGQRDGGSEGSWRPSRAQD